MLSNFKLVPYFNISQKFRSKCAKTKKILCPELWRCYGSFYDGSLISEGI